MSNRRGGRHLLVAFCAIAWLAGCFILGQAIRDAGGSTGRVEVDAQVNDTEQAPDENPDEFNVEFHNAHEVSKDEIPWGFTAGEIVLEDESSAWLLTPETSMTIEGAQGATLEYCIHPWMADSGDGALIEVHAGEVQEQLRVTSEWQTYQLPDDAESVGITAVPEDDRVGDWVVLRCSFVDNSQHYTDDNPFGVTFVGAQSVSEDDIPWGITAGEIVLDDDTTAWFLTPGTSLEIGNAKDLELEFHIHPWVADQSDGVTAQIDAGEESTQLVVTSELQTYRVPEGVSSLKVSALPSDNEDGDWVVVTARVVAKSAFGDGEYVKSATYFGNEWPLNFWNSETDSAPDDFARIRSDGFNSIILVIPWREFQWSMNPPTYNDYAFEKLDSLMDAAEANGLGVYARISYTWDFFADDTKASSDRFSKVFHDETTRQAWMSYAKKLYDRLSAHAAFRGGFITWEDFWGIFDTCEMKSRVQRLAFSKEVGYRDWLLDNFSQIDDYNYLYGTDYATFDAVPVPYKDEPAMESMYRFFDDSLSNLLGEAQRASFPNLSCEVRIDVDETTGTDGKTIAITHEQTYGCGNADYTATMYAIPIGFSNEGEKVSAQDAVEHTNYALEHLESQNSGKPVYVEQFVFTDNTPAFANNAKLRDDEVNAYLDAVAQPLREHSSGYGIWTYRDYRSNMLYNNGFALGEAGWSGIRGVSFEEVDGAAVCHFVGEASMKQAVPDTRNQFESESLVVSFDAVRVPEPGVLHVSVGNASADISIDHEGSYEVSLEKASSFDLTLGLDAGEMYLDNIRLYSHTQEGMLYDAQNNPLNAIEGIRRLNAQLSKSDAA